MDAHVNIKVEKEPEVVRQIIIVEVEKRRYPNRPNLAGNGEPFVAPSAMWPQGWGE